MRFLPAAAGLCARVPTVALACALALIAAGCRTTTVQPLPAPAPAVLEIENLGPCAWRIIVVAAADPRTPHEVTVAIDGTAQLELPSGDYEVTQEALAHLAAGEATRRFNLTLEAGETYRWRLVTLATVARGLTP